MIDHRCCSFEGAAGAGVFRARFACEPVLVRQLHLLPDQDCRCTAKRKASRMKNRGMFLAAIVAVIFVAWWQSPSQEVPFEQPAVTEEVRPIERRVAAGATTPTTSPPLPATRPRESDILHGRVVDLAGKPVQEARVVVSSTDCPSWHPTAESEETLFDRAVGWVASRRLEFRRETHTDAEGEYSFPLSTLPAGPYVVLTIAKGMKPQREEWINTSASTRLDFMLSEGERIAGVVVDHDGQPVSGALVDAFADAPREDATRPLSVAQATTGKDGEFSLDVADRVYSLRATARGFSASEKQQVLPGSEVVMALGVGRVLEGTVRAVDDLRPLADVRVSLHRAEDANSARQRAAPPNPLSSHRRPVPRIHGTTCEQGRFRFKDLGVGRHVLVLERPGFRTMERTLVLLREVETTSIDIALFQSAPLFGRVEDEAGRSLESALIVVSREPGASHVSSAALSKRSLDQREHVLAQKTKQKKLQAFRRTRAVIENEREARQFERRARPIPLADGLAATKTDGKGHFRFDSLGVGNYALSVQSRDHLTLRHGGIKLGADGHELVFVLQQGSRLQGRVLSSVDHEPIADAILRFESPNKDVRVARTSSLGKYQVSGLTDGWDVTISATGYGTTYIEDLEIQELPGVQTHAFKLAPAAVLSGRIVDTSGIPVRDARVSLEIARGNRSGLPETPSERRRRDATQATTRTTSNGRFSLHGVSSGARYQLVVSHPEFCQFRSTPFDVATGEVIENTEVQLSPGARLLLEVTDAEGRPLPGIPVRVRPVGLREGELPPRVQHWAIEHFRSTVKRSLPDGRVVFSGLDPGAHIVSTSAAGFRPFTAKIDCPKQGSTRMPINLRPGNVILGTVVDRAGTPIRDVRIRVESMNHPEQMGGPDCASTYSDDAGRFSFNGLGPGPYDLSVQSRGFVRRSLEAVPFAEDLRVELARSASVSGRVLAAEGTRSPASFRLRVRRKGEDSSIDNPHVAHSNVRWDRQWSNADGSFRLKNLPAGDYVLRVSAQEFADAEVDIRLSAGEELQDFEIRIREENPK